MANTGKHRGHWSDLGPRVASAAIMLPVALFVIIHGGYLFYAAVAAIGAGLAYEGASMLSQAGGQFSTWRWILICLWPVFAASLAQHGDWYPALFVSFASVILGGRIQMVLVPVCFCVASLVFLRSFSNNGLLLVLFAVTIVIASDSCAYVAGRCFGGKKLAPQISPNKTWSGSIGGLAGAAIVGSIWAGIYTPGFFVWAGIAAVLTGIVSQAGDLAESYAKRQLGVKDSGQLIPGHGGLLDRLDGLIVAAPFTLLLSVMSPYHPFWCLRAASFWRDLAGHLVS